MKKIFYYLVLVFVFFIGGNFVSAINATCIYSPSYDTSVKLKFVAKDDKLLIYLNENEFKNGKYDGPTGYDWVMSQAERDSFLEALKNKTCPTLTHLDNQSYTYMLYVGSAAAESQYDILKEIESKFEGVEENKVLVSCKYEKETYYSNVKIQIELQRMSNSGYRYCVGDVCQDINVGHGIPLTYKSGQNTTIYIDGSAVNKLFGFEEESQCPKDIYLNVQGDASNHNYYISNLKDKDPDYYEPPGAGSDSFDKGNGTTPPNYDPTACGIFTQELVDMITDALDLIKIAGPIIALVLGTIDFIKAMTGGDAEKELKTAFTRFSKRLVAAIILFLLPIILAFLLDIFLTGLTEEGGYDPNNPYCGVVDWGD